MSMCPCNFLHPIQHVNKYVMTLADGDKIYVSCSTVLKSHLTMQGRWICNGYRPGNGRSDLAD